MEKEPRKASEVLLELEAKIDILLNIVRTQDLNIKVLSNKINTLLDKTSLIMGSNLPKIEVADALLNTYKNDLDNQIVISPDSSLPIEKEPKGFRRTSRPETYSGDNNLLKTSPSVLTKFPTQIPKLTEPEVIIPKEAMKFIEVSPILSKKENITESTIPIIQRIVDKNGKSIFLADVEILQAENKKTISKTRTNGAGKWMASLPIGEYKIIINKRESLNKEKLEIIQNIQVDGSISPLELQTMIIKS